MKSILLTRGKSALVDDEDFDRVNPFKWHAVKTSSGNYYAARYGPGKKGSREYIYMHGFILGCKGPDHRNGDGLDNRRENLRPATHQQNLQGKCRKRANTSSKYRGVFWAVREGKWMAAIHVGKRKPYLGSFSDELEAARAYDTAARRFFGEFAALNFPTPTLTN